MLAIREAAAAALEERMAGNQVVVAALHYTAWMALERGMLASETAAEMAAERVVALGRRREHGPMTELLGLAMGEHSRFGLAMAERLGLAMAERLGLAEHVGKVVGRTLEPLPKEDHPLKRRPCLSRGREQFVKQNKTMTDHCSCHTSSGCATRVFLELLERLFTMMELLDRAVEDAAAVVRRR
jgi:hypothetical protein